MKHMRGGILSEGVEALKKERSSKKFMGLPKRIAKRVSLPNGACGCWVVGGWDDGKGYKKMRVMGVMHYVHRVVFELYNGPFDWDGNVLHHMCYNRSCCNPTHIAPLTVGENNLLKSPVPWEDIKKLNDTIDDGLMGPIHFF